MRTLFLILLAVTSAAGCALDYGGPLGDVTGTLTGHTFDGLSVDPHQELSGWVIVYATRFAGDGTGNELWGFVGDQRSLRITR